MGGFAGMALESWAAAGGLDETAMDEGGAYIMTSSWQLWREKRGRLSPLRIGTLALLFFPLAKALFDSQAILHGARPINDLIHRAGFWALVFLGVTLAVTPFRRITHYGNLIDARRMLGVGAFCYIAAHLSLFFADQGLSLAKVAHEISHRWYLIVGGTAWLGLATLAATSTDGMVKRLGGLRWRRLHQTGYVLAILATVHFFWQSKLDITEPVIMAGLFLWMMAYRLLPVRMSRGAILAWMAGLAIVCAVLTALGEALYYHLRVNAKIGRVLDASLSFDAGWRPGWVVLAICGGILAVAALRWAIAAWFARAAEPRAVSAPVRGR